MLDSCSIRWRGEHEFDSRCSPPDEHRLECSSPHEPMVVAVVGEGVQAWMWAQEVPGP